MKALCIKLLLCLAIAGATANGSAADKPADKPADKAAKEQARRTQQQLRAIEKEKADLAAQKTQLEGELKASKEKLPDLEQRAARAERARGELSRAIAAAKADTAALAA